MRGAAAGIKIADERPAIAPGPQIIARMFRGDLVAEFLILLPRGGHAVTELIHERFIIVQHKHSQVIAQAVDLVAKCAAIHPGITIEYVLCYPWLQIEREVMRVVGYTTDKPGFRKDHIRPSLACIVEQQDFRRELLTVHSHRLEKLGFIWMRLNVSVKGGLAVRIDPDCDGSIIIVRVLRGYRRSGHHDRFSVNNFS